MKSLLSVNGKVISAESVSPGHPDSAMDYIVNSCLDEVLYQDPNARFACDGVIKNEFITLGGEVTTTARVNYKKIVTKAIEEIGYEFKPVFKNLIFEQSPDIAMGTNDGVGGAGDQGTITGYACNETEEYYPLAKGLADEIMRRLFRNYKIGDFKHAKADMKSQVTVDYTGDVPAVKNVVVAVAHADNYDPYIFRDYIKNVCISIFEQYNVNYDDAEFTINGTGRFVVYGPTGDSGEVGRKIVVDAYGLHPLASVGGGTFNGKDPSKVDKTAAYYTRYVAKNIVAAGLADECRIDVAYCIGLPDPMSVTYYFNNTEKYEAAKIEALVNSLVSYRPKNMAEELNLRSAIHATSGLISHFGQTLKTNPMTGAKVLVPWEELELSKKLKL